ncbi:MAG: hypothetical protein H0X04_00310 [Chthoniobacterales bacterium]|nr:hypothetical protein [Chthoniobacterales bacterium]
MTAIPDITPDGDKMFEINEPLPTQAPAPEFKRCAQRKRPTKHYNADPNASFDVLVEELTICESRKWLLKAHVEGVMRIWINLNARTVQIDRAEGKRWKCVEIYR